jgi:hypothetical protein
VKDAKRAPAVLLKEIRAAGRRQPKHIRSASPKAEANACGHLSTAHSTADATLLRLTELRFGQITVVAPIVPADDG